MSEADVQTAHGHGTSRSGGTPPDAAAVPSPQNSTLSEGEPCGPVAAVAKTEPVTAVSSSESAETLSEAGDCEAPRTETRPVSESVEALCPECRLPSRCGFLCKHCGRVVIRFPREPEKWNPELPESF